MKVSELINTLQKGYKPDDEIMVLWWDKQTFDYDEDDEMYLTNEAWTEICDEFDGWDTAGDEIGQWVHGAVIEKSKFKE